MLTRSETEGSFYPVKDQHIIVSDQVTDIAGNPIDKVLLNILQTDANGRYRHPLDAAVQLLKPIVYDACGNPLSDGVATCT